VYRGSKTTACCEYQTYGDISRRIGEYSRRISNLNTSNLCGLDIDIVVADCEIGDAL
jgi:hypothetical protein